MQARQMIDTAAELVTRAVGYGLLLLIAGAVLARYGVRVPFLAAPAPLELAWLAGAWWLYRGGRLS